MALKPECGQIELVNKHIDHARQVIFPDPVIQPLREKRCLISADTLNETCHTKTSNHA